MTTLDRPGGSSRRLVLIDFDWQDADLLPRLLRTPGVAIRLVAGLGPEDAGVRVAALCGLPRSVELADLTREIFDVALVSDRSPRREQLDRLLRALGTPIQSPGEFVRNGHPVERRALDDPQARDPLNGAQTAPVEPTLAVPIAGLSAAPGTETPCALPGSDDGLGLERALAGWVAETSASSAVLHHAPAGTLVRLSRAGPEDPLLDALVQLAFRLDTPHVMTREDGPQRGRIWAAWPFHTERQHAVLGVAAADAEIGRRVWETAVQALCIAWSVGEQGRAAEPLHLTLLGPEAFSHRLKLTVERHRSEGFRFALYRLTFDGPEAALTELLCNLPDRLRGTDFVCRPAPQELLLLCAGSSRTYAHVRSRIELLWREAWALRGDSGTPPPIADERVELAGTSDTNEFLVAADDWISGH